MELNFNLVSRKEYEKVTNPENGFVKEFGTGVFKFQVIDAAKLAKLIIEERKAKNQSMMVEVNAIKIDKHKSNWQGLTFGKDAITGIYFGIVKGVLDDGNPKWQRIIIDEYTTYNLDRIDEAIKFAILRYNPYILNSPFSLGVPPVYKIVDEEVVATDNIQKSQYLAKGLKYIDKLKKEKRAFVQFARYIDIPVDITVKNFTVLESRMFDVMMNDPKTFVEKYESDLRTVSELFSSALQLNIIKKNEDQVYVYQGSPLGARNEDAILNLAQNESLITSLKMAVITNDTAVNNLITLSEGTNSMPGSEILKPSEEGNKKDDLPTTKFNKSF